MRKGIPFRIATEGSIEFVGETRLFPIFLFDDMDDATLYSTDENGEDNLSCIDDTETVEEPCGGVVKVHACFDNDGFYIARFTDDSGRELPYEPWSGKEEDLVLDLSKRYGDRLRELIVDSSFSTMRLFVEIDTDV